MERTKAFSPHDDYVFSLAWTPDGTRLVSSSGDGTVKVWDARSPESYEGDRRAYEELLDLLLGLHEAELSARFAAATTAALRGAVIRAALEQRK